jgi:hypothetical protein
MRNERMLTVQVQKPIAALYVKKEVDALGLGVHANVFVGHAAAFRELD